MDKVQLGDTTTASENPPSPGESSSSAASEVVLWTHSENSEDSSDGFTESARSMLDFRSPSFSPTLALNCDKSDIVHLAQGASPYLNLYQYSKAVQSPSKSPQKNVAPLKKLTLEERIQSKKVESKVEPNPAPCSSTDQLNYPIPGRRFLPHQLPVYRPRKEHPNVITLMNSMTGPISVLRRVMTEKTRIKIWTRNDKGFRGFLTGFVEAFDKHWNIALRDVDEQFVRKKVTKFPVIGDEVSEGDTVSDIRTTAYKDKSCRRSSKRTPNITKGSNDDSEYKKKEQAISSTFIRLKNYLKQNDGMTRKRMKMGSALATVSTQTNKSKNIQKSSSSSRDATKSKTVYVGDMDPLSICRIGLANLSLCDDVHQHQQKTQRSSSSSRRKSTALTATKPDIIKCHQARHGKRSTTSECSSSSKAVAATSTSSSAPTCSTTQRLQQHTPNIISKTSLKKKSLTVFKTPYEDSFGFMVVAQTRKYELVERHVGQVFLMGNDIVFIETSGGGC